jgi:hypothetical protein
VTYQALARFTRSASFERRELDDAAELVREVPVFELVRPKDLEAVGLSTEAVLGLL